MKTEVSESDQGPPITILYPCGRVRESTRHMGRDRQRATYVAFATESVVGGLGKTRKSKDGGGTVVPGRNLRITIYTRPGVLLKTNGYDTA
jgi:hypothetical protein